LSFSTRKLYKQKGTGNARRGAAGTNLMTHGGVTFAKKARSFRQKMPDKMRRLANRNALLAKVVDGELKIIDKIQFDKPNTKQFTELLSNLKIDRSCLIALSSTQGNEAKSIKNIADVTVTHVDRLNAFDLLNHRYVLAEKEAILAWINGISTAGKKGSA
jgi:large subunit ribosomal protein L4